MSGRARTRELLQEFIKRARARRPPMILDVGVLHALRDLAAACYELGYQDAQEVHRSSTLPAPANYPGRDD